MSFTVVRFTVDFVRGKGRPRFSRRGGITRAFTPEATKQAQDDIRLAYLTACTGQHGRVLKAPKEVPVSIFIQTQRAVPASKPKRIQEEPDVYGGHGSPDIDNVVKLVLDALNRIAYDDDCQVVEIHAVRLPRRRDVEEQTRVVVGWQQ